MPLMKKRCIVDGIMSLHEILHHTHVKKQGGIVFKIGLEKAFDKVNWVFLLKCLKAMGFSDTICDWIEKFLTDGTVSCKINNTSGPYFQNAKGVRQGDPLSPFLFNAHVQCLAKMVLEA
jgi:hypothetical protein